MLGNRQCNVSLHDFDAAALDNRTGTQVLCLGYKIFPLYPQNFL